ncbi:MAG: hypothetical protein GKR90_27450 [Pseudomonadales bacterium]|nr:hypothetical protein [Pseudomonadales bacterium]
MTQAVFLLAAAVIVLLFGLYLAYSQPRPLEPERKHGTVAYVFDGDTIRLKGHKTRIRLWGVDAPEKKQKGYLGSGQDTCKK